MLERSGVDARGRAVEGVQLHASDVARGFDWNQFCALFKERTPGVEGMYLTGMRTPAVVVQLSSPVWALTARSRRNRFLTVGVGQWVVWRGLAAVPPPRVVNTWEEALNNS